MDFVVNEVIVVTELGAFDSAGDGFVGAVTVQLWSRDDAGTPDDVADDVAGEVLATLTFDPANRGDLRDGHRTRALPSAVVLQPGAYTIVASGFGVTDPNANPSRPDPPVLSVIEDPALTFVGSGRFLGTPLSFPTNLDGGQANRYGAGTFAFTQPSDDFIITDFVWDPVTETGSLTFTSVPDADYEIEYSTDLTGGSWQGVDDLQATSTEDSVRHHRLSGSGCPTLVFPGETPRLRALMRISFPMRALLPIGLFLLLLGFANAEPVISEFMASNGASVVDGDGNSSDWIEIYNPDTSAIDLAGWRLRDSNGEWTFPTKILPGGGYLLVFASGQTTTDYIDPGGFLHTDFKLDASGEALALLRPDGSVAFEYPAPVASQREDVFLRNLHRNHGARLLRFHQSLPDHECAPRFGLAQPIRVR